MNILQIDDELSFFASCPYHSKRAPNRFRLLRRIEVLRFTWDELGWFIVASCENVPARRQADSSIRQNSNCSIWQKIISSEVGDKPNNFSAYAQDVSTAKRRQHSGLFSFRNCTASNLWMFLAFHYHLRSNAVVFTLNVIPSRFVPRCQLKLADSLIRSRTESIEVSNSVSKAALVSLNELKMRHQFH